MFKEKEILLVQEVILWLKGIYWIWDSKICLKKILIKNSDYDLDY
jgi:hypothetical protein